MYIKKIASLEQRVAGVYSEEKTRRRLDEADREAEKADNLMQFESEINARPARTWYQTEQRKKEVKVVSRERAREEEMTRRTRSMR